MTMDRRQFMQMLGIGGMALAAQGAPLRLFGTDEKEAESPDELWTPEQQDFSNFLTGHWVVKKKGFIEKAPEGTRTSYGVKVVGRIVTHRRPPGVITSRTSTHTVDCTPYMKDGSVKNAHIAYYMAARQIRAEFAEQSLAFLKHASQGRTPADPPVMLMTEVSSQVFAFSDPHSAGSLKVFCQYEQFAFSTSQANVLETWETYSKSGEYPISVPKDVDFGLLLRADDEIFRLGVGRPQQVVRILGSMT